MARRRKQRAEIWLGLLVIVSAVLLTWGYFWLTGQPLGERGYTVMVQLPDGEGLKRGDRVRVSGVEVGIVQEVRLARPGQVNVELWLQRDLQLPRDSRALLQSASVFGNRYVQLLPGSSETMLSEGDTLAAGRETGLLDLAGQIGEEAELVLRKLDRLLADTAIDNVHGSVASLQTTVRGLERLVRENGDEFSQLAQSLSRTATQLESSMEGADVGGAVEDLERTASSLAETAEALHGSARSLSAVARKIDRGEGTLGRLVNDPSLYEELRSAARSIGSLSRDIQENPGRYLKLAIF